MNGNNLKILITSHYKIDALHGSQYKIPPQKTLV